MISLLIVLLGQEPDSARVDRFIEAVERGDDQERIRRFDDLRSGRVPYDAIATALIARPSTDRVSVWLARVLSEVPPTAQGLSALRYATPPQGSARGEERFRLLLFLEVRHRWGDSSSSAELRALAEDRQIPVDARLAALETLGEPGDAAVWMADESVHMRQRLGAARFLALLRNPGAASFLMKFDEPDLVEGALEIQYEGLAFAAAYDAEAWRAIQAEACPGNPLLTRTILAALGRVSPDRAREFARAYLAAERASEDPDNDPECRNAALELSKDDSRRLLENVETAPVRSTSPSIPGEPVAKNSSTAPPRETSTPRRRIPMTIACILAGFTGLFLLLRRRVFRALGTRNRPVL